MDTQSTTVTELNYDTSVIDDGMKREFQSVRLPFSHVQFLWRNGGENLKMLTNAGLPLMRHFGGWASIGNSDDVKDVAESYGVKWPSHVVRDTLTSDDDKEYDAYVTRYLVITPIVRRISWFNGNSKMRYSKPTKGASTRLQILGLLGESVKAQDGDVTFKPLFPVVLNCKSYAGTYFDDAMNLWDRATRESRKALNVKSPFPFWQAYGSFGDTRVIEQIKFTDKDGTVKNKVLVRPQVLLPEQDKITPDWLRKRLVSKEVFIHILELAQQAAEWRDAYRDLGGGIAEPDFRNGKNGNGKNKELQPPEEPPQSLADDDMNF